MSASLSDEWTACICAYAQPKGGRINNPASTVLKVKALPLGLALPVAIKTGMAVLGFLQNIIKIQSE